MVFGEQFENSVVDLGAFFDIDKAKIVKKLNDWGYQGWETTSVILFKNNLYAFMKRKIITHST
jgi:hypothetical protein